MSPMTPPDPTRERREYHKPLVLKIDLKSDEVLAVGCKMSGPATAFGGRPCVTRLCSQSGGS
jgi:hypothetical protein